MARYAVVGAALAAAIAGGAIAHAAIPQAGTFTACLTGTGALRVINAAKTRKCRSGERLVSWNQLAGRDLPDRRARRGSRGLRAGPGSGRRYRTCRPTR